MNAMAITSKIIKSLYAKSGNICAFPGCNRRLVEESNQSQIAHIISQQKNGPRHIDGYNGGNYDIEDNLILLCAIHHHQIDDNPDNYPIEWLRKIKKEHEAYISELLRPSNITQEFINDFLKICQDNHINKLLYDLNIGASYNDQLLDYADDCYGNLKLLLDNSRTIEIDRNVFSELYQFALTLDNLYSNVALCYNPISMDKNIAAFISGTPNEISHELKEQQKWLQNTYSKYRFKNI